MLIVEFAPPDAVAAMYTCFDAFIAPYVRAATETFAIVNIEAMAMGLPVVHFNIGGMRVCRQHDSNCGSVSLLNLRLLQDYSRHLWNSVIAREISGTGLADAMLMVASNRSLRAELGRHARETAQMYSSSRIERHAAATLRCGRVLWGNALLRSAAICSQASGVREACVCSAGVVRCRVSVAGSVLQCGQQWERACCW